MVLSKPKLEGVMAQLGRSVDKQTPSGSGAGPSGTALHVSLTLEFTSNIILVTQIMSSDTNLKLEKVFEILLFNRNINTFMSSKILMFS